MSLYSFFLNAIQHLRLFCNLYNIMFTTSLLLSGGILASLLLQVMNFDIKIGSADVLLKDYGLHATQDVQKSGLFVRKTLIFPYDIYEMQTPNSNAVEAKSYLFVKMSYTLLADSFDLQNKSTEHVNQYQILYKRIPQIAFFQGKTNQYLELIRDDPSLFNPHFIIKNSTLENRAPGVFTLNFYSLRLTKYLQRIIKSSLNQRKSSLKKQEVKKMLTSDEHFNIQLVTQNEHEANEFVLTKFLDNDIYYKSMYATEIFNVQMTRQITADTLWSAKYDGFSIYYSSAVIKSKKSDQDSKEHATFIDFFLIVSREDEEKRIQHIKQPLDYLNLTTVKHLEICFSMEALKLLLADSTNIYLIDVTTHLWNLDYYKSEQTFQDIFFDKNCRVFNTNNKIVSQINGIRKVQFQNSILSVNSINNFMAFCLEGKICKIYSNDLQRQITDIIPPFNNSNIDFEQVLRVNETQIQHIIGFREKWGHYLLQKKINEFQIIQTTSAYNFSYFYEFVYPFELYLNKPQIKQREMDKMFFHHLEYLQNRDIYKLPQNYFEFSRLLSSSNCTQRTSNESEGDQLYTLNSQGQWGICTISKSTSNLILFKIQTANVEAKMYICQSPLQNYSSNQEIDCQYYTSAANTQKSYYISNNKHIKFYILRVPKQKYFPKFYFRDIEKQQLAFASTVFFFLMLILALSFLVIICFIVFRPVLIGMMVYFGWMQDVAVPTYPLGWLQLKIKIKRLVEMKFLSYVPHEPRNEDEDNHCCFCLQNLSKGALIAQLYCYHEFHKECFNQWIKNQPNLRCPTCRRQFSRQQLNEFRSTHNLVE